MTNTLHNVILKMKFGKNLWTQPLKRCSTMIKTNIISGGDGENEVLKVLNSSSVKRLTKYIDLPLAEILVTYRNLNGPYKSLHDLTNSKIEPKVLDDLFALILDYDTESKKLKKCKVTPNISKIEVPKETMGIHVGPTAIAWTLINFDCKILDWDCVVWRNEASKINTHDIMNLAAHVAKHLPSSSCYVVEEFELARKSLRSFISTQQQLTVSLLSCLRLMQQNGPTTPENSIYILSPLISARFFNLMVGTETVATEYITSKILQHTENSNVLDSESLGFDPKKKYVGKNVEEREQMGWALLKALTFNRLLVISNVNVPYKRSIV